MNLLCKFGARAAAFGSLMTFSAVSLAHVDLSAPNPRAHGQTEGNLKSGPCGQTNDGRTANVNVFTPGQTITVTWNEYVDHPSYYRIAFDDDGDDGFRMRTDGQTNQVADNPQAAEAALNMDAEILAIVTEQNDTTAGTDIRSTNVTLPNITCENCTLQLIQYMYNNPNQGYYQCADIALRAAQETGETAGTPDAGVSGEGGSANAGEAGSAGEAGAAGAAGATAAAGAAGSGGAGGASASAPASGGGVVSAAGTGSGTPQAAGGGAGAAARAGGAATSGNAGTSSSPAVATDGEDDGGCTLSKHPGRGSSAGLVSLLALGVGLIARRRR